MQPRNRNYKVFLIIGAFLVLIATIFFVSRHGNFELLSPKGPIAHQERNLLLLAVSLMLAVAIPMFVVAAVIAWKYRAGNKTAKYTPNWDYSFGTQTTIWGVIVSVIFILAIINWKSTHVLDPYKPLNSSNTPITIQVVALQWKWLFIYPEQNIATVNFIEFPSDTPVNFQLTADAPMNSFWIPQLGGQMYAMPGMSTQLHLEADAPGEFNGSAAEISGAGFAGMKFKAVASSKSDFDKWVASVKQSGTPLSLAQYDELAGPSTDNPVAYYSSTQFALYTQVMMKFMTPPSSPVLSGPGAEGVR